MTGASLARFQGELETVFETIKGINTTGRTPIHVGIALIRFTLMNDNDDLGTETRILKYTAIRDRVAASLRRRDQLIAVDASTVGVIFKGLEGPEHLELAGAKLLRELKAPLAVLDRHLPLRFHAGLVCAEPGDTAEQLVQRAVNAVVNAARTGNPISSNGRSSYVEQASAELEDELADALARGEFVPYFQPKVNAAFQTLVGVETLTRWHSAKRGLVGPNVFIPVLESCGLIETFTHRMLRTALSHVTQWREPMSISINAPAQLLADDALEVAITDALQLFSFAPERLIIEVTETGIMHDSEASVRRLGRLKKLGVQISIDDFGTGYSALAYLRDLPVDEVKLDRAFMAGIDRQPRPRALVSGIIKLAHTLELKVVAEGVETTATAEVLKNLGCDLLQGYLFSKPLPPDQFEAWLRRRIGGV